MRKQFLLKSFIAGIMMSFIMPLYTFAYDQYESMNVGETKTFYFPSEVTNRASAMYAYNCSSDHINQVEVVSYTNTSVTVKALAYTQSQVHIRFDYWWYENNNGRHDTHMVHIDLNGGGGGGNTGSDYNPNNYDIDYGSWGAINVEEGSTTTVYCQYDIPNPSKVKSILWSDYQQISYEITSQSSTSCTIKGRIASSGGKLWCLMKYGNTSYKAYYTVNVKESTKQTLSLSANPDGGKIEKGIKVYLTASVSESDIYYSLDGTWPTTSSTKYSSSGITIHESCELRAFATKSGYNDSPVMSWVFNVEVPKISTTIANVVAGSSHSLIVDKNGTLWSCGHNNYGQLGDGTRDGRLLPTKIMDDVSFVAAGVSHSLIVKKDASLWGCGQSTDGQLGIENSLALGNAEPIKIMDDVSTVAAGQDFSLIVKKDGSLWVCGTNYYGQLGNNSNTSTKTLVKIMDEVTSVAAGDFHSLILKKDGSLWSCGRNYNGQLGDGTNEDKNYPVRVAEDVAFVAAGSYHSMIIKKDGSLWTCGLNGNGQLGQGHSKISISTFTKVMDDVASVGYSKSSVTQIIKKDGSYWACGYNGDDNLGGGPTSGGISTPFKVLDGVSKIASGSSFTLLVKNDGSLWGCGKNGSGQLGDGTTTDRHSLVIIIEGEEQPQSVNPTLIRRNNNFDLFSLSGQRLVVPKKGINIVGGKKFIVK